MIGRLNMEKASIQAISETDDFNAPLDDFKEYME